MVLCVAFFACNSCMTTFCTPASSGQQRQGWGQLAVTKVAPKASLQAPCRKTCIWWGHRLTVHCMCCPVHISAYDRASSHSSALHATGGQTWQVTCGMLLLFVCFLQHTSTWWPSHACAGVMVTPTFLHVPHMSAAMCEHARPGTFSCCPTGPRPIAPHAHASALSV